QRCGILGAHETSTRRCDPPNKSWYSLFQMKLALALSIALNVALVMTAVRSWEKRSPVPQRPLAPAQITHQHESRPAAPTFQLDPVTNRFDWRMIESSDYEEYVANLRAIGCPEKTVRDI